MARIPDDQIERLKAEVSLVRLVEARGVVLKKHGKDWLGRCPAMGVLGLDLWVVYIPATVNDGQY